MQAPPDFADGPSVMTIRAAEANARHSMSRP